MVLIHTTPFVGYSTSYDAWYYLGQVIQQLTSFAVPFFYIVAGYFFSLGIRKSGLPLRFRRQFFRIFFLLAVWTVICGVFGASWLQAVIEYGSLKPLVWNFVSIPTFALANLDVFVFRTTAVPLWFLVSMLVGITAVSLLIFLKLNAFMIMVIGAALYLLALSVGTYHESWLGIGVSLPLEQRGVFLAIFHLAIGHYIACKYDADQAARRATLWLLLAVVLMFAEGYLVSRSHGVTFQEHASLASTPLFAAAVFLLALERSSTSGETFMSRIGTASLGIYVIHIPLLGAVSYYRYWMKSPIWELAIPILVVAASMLLFELVSRLPYLRRTVT